MEQRTDLSVELAPGHKRSLALRNPVMVASGAFGYGEEYSSYFDISRLGAICCKGTTLRPRRGNRTPRIWETPAGMLNSIGLQNIGVNRVIAEKAPMWARWDVPVLVNISGETVEEYARLGAMLDEIPGVAGLEVNISCPNVKLGGLQFGSTAEAAAEVTSAVRQATTLPVMVKLTPNVGDIASIALAVEAAGANSISLVNTLLGMAINVRTRKPALPNVFAGLSGPAIKPVALRMVYEVAGAVKIPVVGMGGIASANDALEFLMAGASAIQVGTAVFVNPRAPIEILDGIEAYLIREGLHSVHDIVGIAQFSVPEGSPTTCQ